MYVAGAQAWSGGGGSSNYGIGGAPLHSVGSGNNATGYGAGGGGAYSYNCTGYAGGNGSAGCVEIIEFF